VTDVLAIYDADFGERTTDPKNFVSRMLRLNEFFGKKVLAEIDGELCRAYVAERAAERKPNQRPGGPGGARRDLEVLRAAINHHAREGYHRGMVNVWLPPKGSARERWLTRAEAARLIWACWRNPSQRHLARFILIGLYTGTRAGAIATASPTRAEGRSWVDLDRGIFYRLAEGRRATRKAQPPVPLPRRLLAHLRRWQRLGIAREHFVEWRGRAVVSVKTGFASAVEAAGIEHASPHTLRHTAATWLMQAGTPIWEAAGFLGMSEETLRRVYGHHHPDYMRAAVAAMDRRAR
jgi:integrase